MKRNPTSRSGFALLDVMIAVVLVGISITALVQSLAAGTNANGGAANVSTALTLARNIHEYALSHMQQDAKTGWGWTTVSGIASLNNAHYGGTNGSVVDSTGAQISGYTGWEQKVQVYGVTFGAVATNQGSIVSNQPVRLVVTICYQGKVVCSQSWIMAGTSNVNAVLL
jgi:type II secretory pathway pseudopilin PulG